MRFPIATLPAAALLAAATTLTPASVALAHHDEATVGAREGVEVSHAYTFANAEMAHGMRVYLTVENATDDAVELTGATADFADAASLQARTMDEGSLTLASLDSVRIAPGDTLTMQPGSVWIELDGVSETFEPGGRFAMTVSFADGSTADLDVAVEARPDGNGDGDGVGNDGGHDHDHGGAV